MLEANRLILDTIEQRVEGELIDSQVEGRVVVEAGARLERATVRGPAIIGAGAQLIDCYVGPYTAIGEDCVDRARRGRALDPARRRAGAPSLDGPHGVLAAGPQRQDRRGDAASRAPTASWSATTPRSGSSDAGCSSPAPPGCSASEVVAAAAAARPRGRRASTCRELDLTDARRDARPRSRRLEPDAVVNCAAYTDVDGAEADEEPRDARQRRRGRQRRARAARPSARASSHVSTDYVFDGRSDEPWRRVRRDRARSAPTAARSCRRGARRRRAPRPRDRPHGLAVRRRRQELRRHDAAPGRGARRGRGRRPTRSARPTWTGHLAPALVDLAERADTGHLPRRRRRARARGTSWRSRPSTRAGVDCRVLPTTRRASSPGPRRARPAACWAPSASDPIALPPWQEGVRAYLAELEEVASR